VAAPTPPETTAAPPPATAEPCPRAEEESRIALAEADGQVAAAPAGMARADVEHAQARWAARTAPLRRCHPGGEGVWILRPQRATFEWTRGDDIFGNAVETYRSEIVVRPAYHGRDGSRLEGEAVTIGDVPLESRSVELTVDGTSDYEGDGAHELIFHTTELSFESSPSHRFFVVTVAGERVVAFGPAQGIAIESAIDADRDGLLDFVGIWPGWSSYDCGMDPPTEGRPSVLFHAQGGRFVTDDRAAARFLRQRCAPAVDPLVPEGEDCHWFALRRRLACARARGETATDLAARLDAALDALPTDVRPTYDVRAELHAYASVDPPLTWRP